MQATGTQRCPAEQQVTHSHSPSCFKCFMYEIALNFHSLHNVNYSRRSCVFSYANILHISSNIVQKISLFKCVCVYVTCIHTQLAIVH